LDNLDTGISLASLAYGFICPPVAGLRTLGSELNDLGRKHPAIDKLIEAIQAEGAVKAGIDPFKAIPVDREIEVFCSGLAMLEGDGLVDADVAIYDPQSAFGAVSFEQNGSRAERLAVLMNRGRRKPDFDISEPPIANPRSSQKAVVETVALAADIR
jgi:hypothetical protein